MKKKVFITFIVAIILIATFTTSIWADEIPVYYNNIRIVFDVNPMVIGGRTLVSMRKIFETFGASVVYDPELKQITATKGSLTVVLSIGSKIVTITRNGVIATYTLEVVPMIIKGRIIVPLRFIGEALGVVVNWHAISRSITIITPEYS